MPGEEGNPLSHCCCFLWSVSKGHGPVDEVSQGLEVAFLPFLAACSLLRAREPALLAMF